MTNKKRMSKRRQKIKFGANIAGAWTHWTPEFSKALQERILERIKEAENNHQE